MREATNTFISSTFWTERIGSAAAIENIKPNAKDKELGNCFKTGKK